MKLMKYLYACSLLVLCACGNDDEPTTYPPTVTTGNVSDIYREGAVLYGSIENSSNADIKEFGVLCSDHQSMDEPQTLKAESDDLSDFNVTIRNLSPGKTYYYCAYASSGYSMMKGEVKTFNTTQSNPPIFNEVSCDVSYENGFKISAHVEDIGDQELLLCGFCYKEADGTGTVPTIADKTIYVKDLNVDFSSSIEGLLPNTTYLVRAFAGNSCGVGYSKTVEISTSTAIVPVVSAISVDAVSVSALSISASVWLPEGEVLSEAGFCWTSESAVPTIEHNHQNVKDQMQGDKMSYQIEGLAPETEYNICAYVKSTTHGVIYGSITKVRTNENAVPEVVPGGSIEDLPTEEL